jgi:hypothetical protein
MAQIFQMFPWRGGGLNTSQDPAQIANNELTLADHIQYGPTGSTQKREGINFDFDDATSGTDDIIGGCEFWYGTGSSRTQKYVVVTEGKKIYSYNPSTGARSADLFAGTAWATTPTKASFSVLNNLLIITVDGGNAPKKFDGTTVADLGGTPPNFEWTFVHQGRLMGGVVDRLHYSPPFDPETWNGTGDSGAVDVNVGDGDPKGLTGGFSFLGTCYVGKRNRLHRLKGEFPDVKVELVARGIGIESHDSIVCVEDSDVAWCSGRGFHSLAATDQYGDLKSAFISKKIQLEFNESFTRARLPYVKGVYVASLNSIAWAVTHEDYGTTNNCIYLYSLEGDGWYRWSDIDCQALFAAEDTDAKRFYIGTSTGRLAQALTGGISDTNESGTEVAIERDTASGRISIDGSLVTDKRFTAFYLIYRPDGDHTITVDFRVDGQAAQSLVYSDTTGAAALGAFTLGTDILGSTMPVDAYGLGVDGIGSTFSVRIRQSGTDEYGDILGFAVAFEPAGHSMEVMERAD